VVGNLGPGDDATMRLAAVVLLLADELDRLAAEVGRLAIGPGDTQHRTLSWQHCLSWWQMSNFLGHR
jgi:hypothetical protein